LITDTPWADNRNKGDSLTQSALAQHQAAGDRVFPPHQPATSAPPFTPLVPLVTLLPLAKPANAPIVFATGHPHYRFEIN